MSSLDELLHQVRTLRDNGQAERATETLKTAAAKGCVPAMVELALDCREEKKDEESASWINAAECAISPYDIDGHISLASAYRLGLGKGDLGHLQQQALRHLELVALAGNNVAQEELALHFLHGLNGCQEDWGRFQEWIERASSSGSARAAYIYAEALHARGRTVPTRLIVALKADAENASSAKLLRKIARIEGDVKTGD